MMRILTHLMLALVLALTSQSMAVARGAAAATGQMVLCTGTGPVAVYVDRDGHPTSAPHICPDAALDVPGDPAVPYVAGIRLVRWQASVAPSRQQPPLHHPSPLPPLRGPPLSV